MKDKKLFKGHEKMIAAVCSGLAEYFEMDVTVVRAIFAAGTLVLGVIPGIILYVVLMIIMPEPAE